jgi:hypothetical protein
MVLPVWTTMILTGQCGGMEGLGPGDRMFVRCRGGPSHSRLERYPPPLEIQERGGVYVLEDEGPPEEWCYQFVPDPV